MFRPHLLICLFLPESLAATIKSYLNHNRYQIIQPETEEAFFSIIEQDKQQLDCLILLEGPNLVRLTNWLHSTSTLLPAVILQQEQAQTAGQGNPLQSYFYHSAEVLLSPPHLDQISYSIEQAIAEFLHLSPSCRLSERAAADLTADLTTQNFLMLQQRRLTEKLKERLGYLGVYYKRSPQNFLRHLPPPKRQELLEKLKEDYRDIILNYFLDDDKLNQRIDNFVNMAFFADISVSQIVETHMELMDEFAKQLKLEGRSEEILLDYRLTLIDTIAHLCEMYRRSIPRES